jgi:hypothetical protein
LEQAVAQTLDFSLRQAWSGAADDSWSATLKEAAQPVVSPRVTAMHMAKT